MKIEIEVSAERIANLMISAIESGDPVTTARKGGWCDGILLESHDQARIERDSKGPWYAEPKLYTEPNLKLIVIEITDESKPDGEPKNHFVGLREIGDGLTKLASGKYAHHFGDILSENSDAATADIFLQFVLFGEEKYA